MHIRRIAALVALGTACGAATVSAQDSPRLGLSMGYPASIGVLWHMTDRVAVRPELSLSRNSTEFTSTFTTFSSFPSGTTTTTTTTTTAEGWQVGAGASALFYLQRRDALRTYVSPRFAYTRGTTTTTSRPPPSPIAPVGSPTSETKNSTYFASGSFGAQYALGTRFGVFGEVGLGFGRSESSGGAPTRAGSKTRNLATRSGVGVLFYF
jgi:hypothetical protein